MAVGALILTGCGEPVASPSPVTVTVPAPVVATRVVAPEPEEIATKWPLTGIPAKKIARRPALSVKIENSPAARPQIALDQADIVYEELVEGGITRFIAVYHSKKPDQVGPIRSVRPMDANIIAPLGGLLAFSGGKAAFSSLPTAAGLQVLSMDRGDAGFSRISGRAAPHNVVGDLDTFWKQATGKNKKRPPAPFSFADSAEEATAVTSPEAKATETLSVRMSMSFNPRWHWDGAKFLRSEGEADALVADGSRISADNIVVLSVDIHTTSYRDAGGAFVPETIVIGNGNGLLSTGGKTVEITWSKADQQSPFVLEADGEEVTLAPGNTWVELMPSSQSWTVS